jgi:hypothetical protein
MSKRGPKPAVLVGKTVRQWAEELGISPAAVYSRMRRGRPVDLSGRPRSRGRKPAVIGGKTVREWAEELGMTTSGIYGRLRQGRPVEAAKYWDKPAYYLRTLNNPRNLQVYRARLRGQSFPALAREFGMTHQGAQDICRRVVRALEGLGLDPACPPAPTTSNRRHEPAPCPPNGQRRLH